MKIDLKKTQMVNMLSNEVLPQEISKKKPFFIGVSGGTASGKTTVCKTVIEQIKEDPYINDTNVAILYADLFYKDLSEANIKLANQGKFNFDHPNAIDFQLFYDTICKLQSGVESVQVPIYSYKEHKRVGETEFKNADVIIIEGILIFYDVRVRDIFELKIFVDCDADTRLARRVERDIMQRGRTIDTVLFQYTEFVKPAFEDFCLPTKKYVDIILPRGKENIVAINLISQHVHDLLSGTIDDRQKRLRRAKVGCNSSTPSKPSSPIEGPLKQTDLLMVNDMSTRANGETAAMIKSAQLEKKILDKQGEFESDSMDLIRNGKSIELDTLPDTKTRPH